MPKGTPRTATAASAILQQATTPEQGQEQGTRVHATYDREPAYKPATKGVKAGLKPGETRITCIYRDEQGQVLHDWAKTTGRTFREVCLAMADHYIEEVIRPATSGDRKLKAKGDVPEEYADLYAETPDEWAQFF